MSHHHGGAMDFLFFGEEDGLVDHDGVGVAELLLDALERRGATRVRQLHRFGTGRSIQRRHAGRRLASRSKMRHILINFAFFFSNSQICFSGIRSISSGNSPFQWSSFERNFELSNWKRVSVSTGWKNLKWLRISKFLDVLVHVY